jgi:hypothetical protein
MGEKSIPSFVGKTRQKKSLGKPRRWWEANNKTIVRLCTGPLEHGNKPSGSAKYGLFLDKQHRPYTYNGT